MSGSPAGGATEHAGVDGLDERPVLVVGLLHERLVHRLDVHVRDALGVLAAQLHRVAVAVDDVAGVEAEADVLGVGRLEDAVDVVGGLDVAVAVRVEDHLQAVVLLHDPPEPVGVLDVEVPGVGGEHAGRRCTRRSSRRGTSGAGARRTRRPRRRASRRWSGRTSRCRPRPRPGAGCPSRCRRRPVKPRSSISSLRRAGLGREVAERAGLHHGEAGGRHLVERDVPVDLLLVLREPDAPLVGADTDRQLAVAGVGVAGLGLRHWRFLPSSVGCHANLIMAVCSVNRS